MRKQNIQRLWAPASLFLGAVLVTSGIVLADVYSDADGVPQLVPFQGYLSLSGGAVDTSTSMSFSMYSHPSPSDAGDTLLWGPETHTVIPINGEFRVMLGETVALTPAVLAGGDIYVEVTVAGTTLNGRQRLGSVPYALRSAVAKSAEEMEWSGLQNVPSDIADGDTPQGVTFTHWGRNDCPSGSSLVYRGYAAGGWFDHVSGTGSTLCLNEAPEHPDNFNDGNNNQGIIYGAEFETSSNGISSLASVYQRDVSCAVCLVPNASLQLMIPGSRTCPSGWTRQVDGVLMSGHYGHRSSTDYTCVNKTPMATGSTTNHNGSLFYPVEAECGSLPCGNGNGTYRQDRELSCSICTR